MKKAGIPDARELAVCHNDSYGSRRRFVRVSALPAILAPVLFCFPASAFAADTTLGIPSTWGFLSLGAMLGGLALLLVGMDMLSDGLKRLAGGKFAAILIAVTRRRVVALLAGALVTAMIQSSAAMTVILVSLVESNLMTFQQTVPLILGANIGTTVSAQIIAFKVTDAAFLIVGVGFAARTFLRGAAFRAAGNAAMGLGIVFLGLNTLSTAMRPIRDLPWFTDALASLANVPTGVLVGTVFTALVQSSAATLGILIAFASQGILPLETCVPVVLGANIGTCFTAILAALPDSREAKRVALVHTFFNVGGVLLVVSWIPTFTEFVVRISPPASSDLSAAETLAATVPRQVANAHTLFNFGVALFFLPLTGFAARLMARLVPRNGSQSAGYYLDKKLLRSFSESPELALEQSRQALRRAVEWTRDVLTEGMRVITHTELPDPERVARARRPLVALRRDITDYLNALSERQLSNAASLDAANQTLCINELDHITQVILATVEDAQGKPANFSAQGRQELTDYLKATLDLFDRATAAFLENSPEKAREAGEVKRALKEKEDRYRRTHIERMRSRVAESIRTDTLHMDVLDALRHVNTYSGRIARLLLLDEDDRPMREEESPPLTTIYEGENDMPAG